MRPILHIRAEALRANLENIKHHLDHARNPRAELEQLQKDLAKSVKDLAGIQTAVYGLATELDSDTDAQSLEPSARKALQNITDVRDGLKKTEGEIKKMVAKYARMQDDEVVLEIAESLSSKTEPTIQQIARVEQGLRLGNGNVQQLWTMYLGTADQANHDIFGAYIELLGGMALRDVGFDDGTSRLAEELLRTCTTGKAFKPMVAIPTRQKAMTMTLGRVIRVTYPDWTLWALPSTAFEFWQEVAVLDEVRGPLERQLQQITGSATDTIEERFRNCLGDAFATFTMGPAYACFAIYLLLNPSSPWTASDGHAADQIRVEGIFQMLRRMDSEQSPAKNGLFSEIANELEKAWKDAVEQTRPSPPGPEQQTELAADRARISDLVHALWQGLIEKIAVPFSTSVWGDILNWVGPLQDGTIDAIQLPPAPELRHVLNAAWLARVADDRKGKLELLTKNMGLLAERIKTPVEGPQRVYAQRAL